MKDQIVNIWSSAGQMVFVTVTQFCHHSKNTATDTDERNGIGREVGGGSGCGTHVNPWLIHVWQKPLQYCKVISLQLIKNKWKKKQEWRRAVRVQAGSYLTLRVRVPRLQ